MLPIIHLWLTHTSSHHKYLYVTESTCAVHLFIKVNQVGRKNITLKATGRSKINIYGIKIHPFQVLLLLQCFCKRHLNPTLIRWEPIVLQVAVIQ